MPDDLALRGPPGRPARRPRAPAGRVAFSSVVAGLAGLAVRVQRLDPAADHGRDQRVVVEVGHRARRAHLAVAQHGDAVADLEHLLEPVGDVEHRHARPRAARPISCSSACRLLAGQRGRRLVEDDHAGVARRAPWPPRSAAGWRAGASPTERARVDVLQPDARQQLRARSRSAPTAHEPAARRQPAHQQVVLHRELGQQAKLLVDDADARRAGLGRAGVAACPRRRPGRSPASRRMAPVSTLMIVDLPAPFSPARQCTSPAVELEVDVLDRL